MAAFSAHRSVYLLLSVAGGNEGGGQSDWIQRIVFFSLVAKAVLPTFLCIFCFLFLFAWRRLGVCSPARVRVTRRKAGAPARVASPPPERSQSQIYQRVNCRVRRYGTRATLRDVAASDWARKLGSGAKKKKETKGN